MKLVFTTVYVSAAAPSFPFRKTCINHLARIGQKFDSWGGHKTNYHFKRHVKMSPQHDDHHILQESGKLLDSWGGHKTNYFVKRHVKMSPQHDDHHILQESDKSPILGADIRPIIALKDTLKCPP